MSDGAHGRYAGSSVAGGRYQLRDLLGEGGMASVHLAYDSVLDRHVAIKTLHTELGREPAFRERFRREAQSVARLTHANIVSVFDTGEDTLDGATTPYIVMEYIEGRPLGSVLDSDIQQYGAMPADRALKITADVLAALEISHEMGLVHRDIKPGNVMMTKRNVVKVMDFGIARAMQSGVTSMTQTGMVVGTPQYLSPEQALGRGVDARSDLYSVGIMLFQLVTGRLPFEADSPLAIAYAHVQEEPVAPSSINRALPPAVDAIVARALRKNPNERFPSAEAMRDECLRIAQSLQPAAPSIVPGAHTGSGSGVGSAVFPPLDGNTANPSGQVQQPYQSGGYTPAPTPGYGYPQQGGYQTPAPSAYNPNTPAPGPYNPSTPAPYNVAPATTTGASAGKKKNMPVIVGSIVVALIAIGGLITVIATKDDGGDPKAGGDASATPSGFKGPDLALRINETQCTEATPGVNDEDKIQLPDFRNKTWTSVQKCISAAGWGYDNKNRTDENTWGKDTVIFQHPAPDTEIDPDDETFKISFTLSTGKPAA
ncbi:protein kinase [Streptomyces sp. NA04227]|uniref:protein kinase domain-containing protein n=1 Tax=Streptomyces sp. NA04227 TaxID=2742136 RepID=UPI00158FCEA6|nr:protein kinase [Streptomyces sp. NA04227]QKW07706.1 protein kinase [Streptomyces sp. NA04227]